MGLCRRVRWVHSFCHISLKISEYHCALKMQLRCCAQFIVICQEHTKEELDAWKLVRVHEDFRVIALGLPVPRYQGNPLDPPLRSRFQARDVHPIPFKVFVLHIFLHDHMLSMCQ